MAGRTPIWLLATASVLWLSTVVSAGTAAGRPQATVPAQHIAPDALFVTADTCLACHNGLTTPSGEDVSFGADWRGSMMANSARDPYWQAAVRREIMDYPDAQAAIEDECSICHMPMTTFPARASQQRGRILPYLPVQTDAVADAALAADGVSCAICHQLSATRLGDSSTFTGGYVIDVPATPGDRRVFGPYTVDAGRTAVMKSSSGFTPTTSAHLQQAEVCASCHTLYTHALAPGSAPGLRLPEQTPYLEWQQSEFATTASCQSCHMPTVTGTTAVASVLGQPREGVSRHTFRGGNFFMLSMLNRYRDELGVRATPREMDAAIRRTEAHLQEDTVRLSLPAAARAGARLEVDVRVQNLAGHKFPTAYPSRRAWIQLTVADASGRVVFESGAFAPDGRIGGNDQDADGARFEPHYTTIDRPDQVQIYESVMGDPQGRVTTGLLTGASYLKDNRLLPRGFDKAGAVADIAVRGGATKDGDFAAGEDRVRYVIDVSGASGPLRVTARMWFQPIAFRWAENLRGYDAFETRRFLRYYESMAAVSALPIAAVTVDVR